MAAIVTSLSVLFQLMASVLVFLTAKQIRPWGYLLVALAFFLITFRNSYSLFIGATQIRPLDLAAETAGLAISALVLIRLMGLVNNPPTMKALIKDNSRDPPPELANAFLGFRFGRFELTLSFIVAIGSCLLGYFFYNNHADALIGIHCSPDFIEAGISHSPLLWLKGLGFSGVVLLPLSLILLPPASTRAVVKQSRTKQQPAQSDELYKDLLDSLPYAVHICDTSGIITFINSAHSKLLGYDPLDLVDKSVFDYFADSSFGKKDQSEYGPARRRTTTSCACTHLFFKSPVEQNSTRKSIGLTSGIPMGE